MILLMDCHRVQQLMPDYAYRGVSRWQHWQIAAHLRMCPGCGRDWEIFRREGEMLDALPPLQAPDGMWEKIEAGMKRASREDSG